MVAMTVPDLMIMVSSLVLQLAYPTGDLNAVEHILFVFRIKRTKTAVVLILKLFPLGFVR